MADMQRPNETAAWQALEAHYQQIKDVHLRQLFADDPGRGERLTVEGAGLYLDYSKNRITDETVRLLLQLAQERGVAERRDAMFRGDKINITEQRAVLHVALRAPKDARILVDGHDVVPDVHQVLDAMASFRRTCSLRRLARAHRQAHPQRGQYRHRRFVSRTGDGLSRAAPVQRPIDDVPLRVQRRRRRLHRGHA